MKVMRKTRKRRKPYRKTAPPVPVQDPNATAEDVARALGFVPPHQRPEVRARMRER